MILENCFNLVKFLDSKQILILAHQLDVEICCLQDNLIKWKTAIQSNISKISEKLVCGLALEMTANLVSNLTESATKSIIDKTDFVSVI